MSHTLRISPRGRLTTVYTDKLPLGNLGELLVKRASNVEFNDATQCWEVRWTRTPEVISFSHPSRQTCLDWEVAELQRNLHLHDS